MNLYCYNSPTRSSTGFQERFWNVRDGNCTVMNPEDAAPELRRALLDGGAKALCVETGRGTRAFILREIFVRQGAQSGWHMNVILEADPVDYALWADTVSAFLSDYAGLTARLAGLFSVAYDGGEHYELDMEGFVQLLCDAKGAAASLCAATGEAKTQNASQAAFHTFAEKMCAAFSTGVRTQPYRLLLLVPTASVDYFMRHTSLKELNAPEICIGAPQWEALLRHDVPEDDLKEAEAEEVHHFSLEMTHLAISTVGAALVTYSIYRIIKRLGRKRKGR